MELPQKWDCLGNYVFLQQLPETPLTRNIASYIM